MKAKRDDQMRYHHRNNNSRLNGSQYSHSESANESEDLSYLNETSNLSSRYDGESGEESSMNSGLTGGTNNSAAPSALRKSKYSRYPYARSDIDSETNNSLGSSISSYNSYNNNSLSRSSPQNYSNIQFSHSYDSHALEHDYHEEKEGEKNHRKKKKSHRSKDQEQNRNANESFSHRSAMTYYSTDQPLPSHTILQNGVSIGATGYILGRHTRLELFFKKKWKEYIWVHCKPVSLLFFSSKSDCLKWMQQRYVPQDEKKSLIKHHINFDPMGILAEKDAQQFLLSATSNVTKFDMSEVRSKRESVDGSYTHRFTVDRWKSIGTNVEMMFCSSHVIEIKSLRKAIRKCVKKVSSATLKKSKPTSIIDGSESIDDASVDKSQTSGTMSRTSNASYNSYKHSSRTRKARRRRL